MPSATRTSRTSLMAKRIGRAVGDRIKAERRKRRIPQAIFAKSLGLSRTTVSNIERGEQRLFLDQVYRVADVLGLSISSLLVPQDVLVDGAGVRAAADDPLPAKAIRQVAEVARELVADYAAKRHSGQRG